MGLQNGKEKLFTGIVKVNMYSIMLAILTGLITDIFIGIISFAFYIHVIAVLPALLGLKKFSEIEILDKLREVFRKKMPEDCFLIN